MTKGTLKSFVLLLALIACQAFTPSPRAVLGRSKTLPTRAVHFPLRAESNDGDGAQVAAGGINTSGEPPFEIRGFSLATSFLAAGDLLLNSHLIATLPSKLANDLVGKYPSLQLFTPPLPTPSFKIKLAWHDRHDSEPSHQWMRETLVELLAEPGARKRAGRGAPDPLYEVSEAHV